MKWADVAKEILKLDSYEDAMDLIMSNCPDKYILQSAAIDAFLTRRFSQNTKPKYDISKFNREAKDFGEDKTLIFVGPTGIGKTAYALAHFQNPILISDRQDFGKVTPQTDGLVIDDMSFNKWNPTNLIHLVDVEYDRTINVKYGSARLRAGLRRIITVNSMELFWPESMLDVTREALIILHVLNQIRNS